MDIMVKSPILIESGEITMWVGSTTYIQRIKEEEQPKNDFIGMVSHELKTPLTSLNAYLQVRQSKLSNSTDQFAQRSLEQLLKQVKKMTAMINGFLNVFRREAGKINIDKRVFDIQELFIEAKDETSPMVNSHSLIFDCLNPALVSGDRNKLGQVLNNLISNAVKYSQVNSNVYVTCTKDDSYVTVAVRLQKALDFGVIKNDLYESLFELYEYSNRGTNFLIIC